jgi:hypothetical protein
MLMKQQCWGMAGSMVIPILFYIMQCIKHGERSSSLSTSSIPKGARKGIIFHIKLDEAWFIITVCWNKFHRNAHAFITWDSMEKVEFTLLNIMIQTHFQEHVPSIMWGHGVIVLKKTIHHVDIWPKSVLHKHRHSKISIYGVSTTGLKMNIRYWVYIEDMSKKGIHRWKQN